MPSYYIRIPFRAQYEHRRICRETWYVRLIFPFTNGIITFISHHLINYIGQSLIWYFCVAYLVLRVYDARKNFSSIYLWLREIQIVYLCVLIKCVEALDSSMPLNSYSMAEDRKIFIVFSHHKNYHILIAKNHTLSTTRNFYWMW